MYMAGHLGIGDEARMDNERDCNNCVYSTRDGNCRKFTCEGTKTVEQIRADAIDECIEWAKAFREAHYYNIPYENLMEYSKGFKKCIESVIENLEQLKEQK